MAEPPEGERRGGRDMGWVGWKVVFLLVKTLPPGWEGLNSPPWTWA